LPASLAPRGGRKIGRRDRWRQELMKLETASLVAAAGWLLAWATVAIFIQPGSTVGRILLVGAGVVPPVMVLTLWRAPAQTLSESIRGAIK
jgi:hypothetical protein